MASFARHLLAGSKPLCGAVGLATGLSLPAALAEKKGDKDPGRPMFDPEALERGAAALREINKSPYGKQVSLLYIWPTLAAAWGEGAVGLVRVRCAVVCCGLRSNADDHPFIHEGGA